MPANSTETQTETRAIWYSNTVSPTHPVLDRDLEVDVAIIGGGLMGVTAALELRRTGVNVALLERRFMTSGDTGHTTAHVTARPDVPMRDVVKRLGVEGANQLWQAMDTALRHIEARSEQLRVPFARVDAWLFGKRATLEAELEALLSVGSSARIETPAAPFPFKFGLCVPQQARFDVSEYLRATLEQAQRLGAEVYEQSAVTRADGNDLQVTSPKGQYRVRAGRVIIATHVPVFANPILLDRLRPDQSYAIAVAVGSGRAPDVLAEDDHDPYHYYRLERGALRGHAMEDIVIFGGEDHKTGETSSAKRFESLERELERWLPGVPHRPLRQWSGELWTTADGLPMIGEDDHGRYFGTGFAGVGMTQATAAGLMAADWVRGRGDAPWAKLFSPARFSTAELPGILERGAGFVANLVSSKLPRKLPTAEEIAPGDGAKVRTQSGVAAAYRDLGGHLHLLNPSCTHAGCELQWNATDRTWDCGCHGSRFTAMGEVRSGPAVQAMKELEEKR
jgi:glycine/D-amino acid oxidase-like deaminating enzyme/nitrite reductase/ring-hydroxylating ferredoxin subunit